MAWEDEDFEQFLKQFHLKESRRNLPPGPVPRSRRFTRLAAVAAAILVIVGVVAAAQYFQAQKVSDPVSSAVLPTPTVVAQVAEPAAATPEPAPSQPTTPPSMPSQTLHEPESSQAAKKLAPEPRPLTTRREIPPEPAQVVVRSAPVNSSETADLQVLRARLTLEAEQETGRRVFERACGACHVPTLIGNSHWDTPLEYADFLNKKIATGAVLSAEEVTPLANYLFGMYGRQQQQPSQTDPGKGIFDAACVQCHAADVMKNHAYPAAAPYRQMVIDMIAKGAIVSESQVDLLTNYLLRTYGLKGRP